MKSTWWNLLGRKQLTLAIRRDTIKSGERRPIVRLDTDVPDVDKIGPYEVVVMLFMSTVCDTDYDMGVHDHHGKETIGFPGHILFGHEGGGIVIAVGSKVTSVKPGDWVSVKVRSGGYGSNCINCRAGQPERCLTWNGKRNARTPLELEYDIREIGIFLSGGTMTEYLQLSEKQVIKMPAGLPARFASFGEPGGVLMAAFLRAFKLWWGDNDWMETTDEGRPHVAFIGFGGLGVIGAPGLTEMPGYFFDAIRDGVLPASFFSRPLDEIERAAAGLAPKQLVTPIVDAFGRRAGSPDLYKVRVPAQLGVRYHGFEELGMTPVEVETGAGKRQVYNTGKLVELTEKGKFDWVFETVGDPCQALSLALPVEPEAKFGGLTSSGTRGTWSSIAGGNEVFKEFPAARLIWGATMNNAEWIGVVNYPALATVLYFYALRAARNRVPTYGDECIEMKLTPDQLCEGEGKSMYDLKRQASGKIAVVMNPPERIQEVCDGLGVPCSFE